MKLQNPFPELVRLLFFDVHECWLCGRNGWNAGGLELHHIMGRISASAFNAAVLCNECHSHMGHGRDEHQRLFAITIRFLKRIRYVPSNSDWDFLHKNYRELVSKEIEIWLTKK